VNAGSLVLARLDVLLVEPAGVIRLSRS